jgi:hypothetical protein
LGHERQTINQDSVAGPIASERLHQVNGSSSLHSEEALAGGAIDDRSSQGLQLLDDVWNTQ